MKKYFYEFWGSKDKFGNKIYPTEGLVEIATWQELLSSFGRCLGKNENGEFYYFLKNGFETVIKIVEIKN